MAGDYATTQGDVQVFTGGGSRVNRVHVFDRTTGSYVTRGFTRGRTLFVRKPVELTRVTIREFQRRSSPPARLAASSPGSAAGPVPPLQRELRSPTLA